MFRKFGVVLLAALATQAQAGHQKDITLEVVGTYATGAYAQGGAEISAHDPETQRLFTVNAAKNGIDIIDISNPAVPAFLKTIDISAIGTQANSVAWHDGVLAAAIESNPKQAPGAAAFYDADGNLLSSVAICSLPDMVTWTPNGKYALLACEGEPDNTYAVDPDGAIAVIKVDGDAASVTPASVRLADFSAYNGNVPAGVRVFGPNANAARDFEPEYITVSHDSKTAWVTLQENNAFAIVNISDAMVTQVVPLGFKDHRNTGNGLDPSDRDGPSNTGAIRIANWPVFGMYLPDSIASFRSKGRTYLVTANEGDSRSYAGFDEERRVGASTVVLDPTVFPNATALKGNAQLGRLKITSTLGDADNDGDFDALYAFGARSMTVWDDNGVKIADTGDELERQTAVVGAFNSDNAANNSFDQRSDDKGPEPEGLAVGKAFGRTYAFLGLERIGGVVVYDLDIPTQPRFVTYINNRNFAGNAALGTAGDLGPEGILYIEADDSPTDENLVVVSNEISGTATLYRVVKVK